jgi:hypothetical protein
MRPTSAAQRARVMGHRLVCPISQSLAAPPEGQRLGSASGLPGGDERSAASSSTHALPPACRAARFPLRRLRVQCVVHANASTNVPHGGADDLAGADAHASTDICVPMRQRHVYREPYYKYL